MLQLLQKVYNYTKAPKFNSWEYKKDDAYIHFCLNETVNGVEYFDDPKINNCSD